MRVGIIGIGVVGGALLKALTNQKRHQIFAYDINGGYNTMAEICKCDVVFVCVPTPTVDGVQNLSALNSVFANLDFNEFKGIAVIKSTVLPGTCRALQVLVEFPIVHNPEFLTAAKPYDDFMNQNFYLLSGNFDACHMVGKVYDEVIPKADWQQFDSWETTELAKYMHNTFLSLKISFCNEIFDICQKFERFGVNYEDVRNATISQEGIGSGHTSVPGPDGSRGFGGMCFVKDTMAFSRFCWANGLDIKTIDTAIDVNKKVRPNEYSL